MATGEQVDLGRWGPLATPIHAGVDARDDDGTPWREYALFCWWDPGNDVYVMTHHMTSPDEEFRGRSRVSAYAGSRSVEVIEPTHPDSHQSDSIAVDLGGSLRVDHPELSLDARFDPYFSPIDFHAAKGLPSLKPDRPLHHYEQPLRAGGTIAIAGEERSFDAAGLRDRTWGYRSESAIWDEYQYIMVDLGDSFLVLLKMKGTVDQRQIDLGFRLTDSGQENVGFVFARNGSGLLNDVTVEVPGGTLTLDIVKRPVGFWVPQGGRQTGPTFSAYDEFVLIETSDGRRVAGLATYGILRKLI
jgi:hypothetical protein